MLYKSNKLFVVRLAKVISVNNEVKNMRIRYRSKFYVAYLKKVSKNGCEFELLSKGVLVKDNFKLVNSEGECYINYKEALNLATGMYKKEYYSTDEILKAEEQINKDRENVK